MPIQVFSETAPLKTVLLHRPGRELEHLVPGTMGRLPVSYTHLTLPTKA